MQDEGSAAHSKRTRLQRYEKCVWNIKPWYLHAHTHTHTHFQLSSISTKSKATTVYDTHTHTHTETLSLSAQSHAKRQKTNWPSSFKPGKPDEGGWMDGWEIIRTDWRANKHLIDRSIDREKGFQAKVWIEEDNWLKGVKKRYVWTWDTFILHILDGGKQREENGQQEVLDRWMEERYQLGWMANQYSMDISICSYTKRLVEEKKNGLMG